MSMYLSNSDVGPTGAEPGEFIDFPPTIEELRMHLLDTVHDPTTTPAAPRPGTPRDFP